MKYKVGDKVERVGTVSDAGTFMMKVIWDNGDYSVFIGDEDVMPLEPPAPVVWRDGAVERWNPVCSRDVKEGFYRITKDVNDKEPRWSSDLHGWDWESMLWLPASEFPMPTLPEPVIENCPFTDCGGECVTQSGCGVIVKCEECTYQSSVYNTKKEVITAHNELCRKVSHAQD